jgi:propionate CoA-transferase
LRDRVVYLEEVAPGISVERDIMPFIEGGFVVSSSCKLMSEDLFFL